jgi:hypothetical protein
MQTRPTSTVAASAAAACPAAGVSARARVGCPCLPTTWLGGLLTPLSLAVPHIQIEGKACQMGADCQSGSCEGGRCAEAKYCASRFLYDNLGANIQLRTYAGFEAPLGHQKAIKCGQCVCQDCPVRMRLGAPASKIVVCPPARPPAACCQPSLGLPTWRRPMLPIARRTR